MSDYLISELLKSNIDSAADTCFAKLEESIEHRFSVAVDYWESPFHTGYLFCDQFQTLLGNKVIDACIEKARQARSKTQ